MPQDVLELKQLNKIEVDRCLNESLQLTPRQLDELRDDPETMTLQHLVISIIQHGINKGDPMRLNFLLDRLIGKVKDVVDVHVDPLEGKSREEIISMARSILEKKNESSN